MQHPDTQTLEEPKSTLKSETIGWIKTFAGAFVAYCALTTIAIAQYYIPSESMAPSLEVGDRVLVTKFAYGFSRYSLPLGVGKFLPSKNARLFAQLPARGDVVVFADTHEDKDVIKRVIGLPGDVIEVRHGVLVVNGETAALSEGEPLVRNAYQHGPEHAIAYEETLPGGVRHTIHRFPVENELAEFGPYIVPDAHVFVMGDNRDNSLDSRWPGMGPIPIENLIGRAETVVFAPRSCESDEPKCRPRWLAPFHD